MARRSLMSQAVTQLNAYLAVAGVLLIVVLVLATRLLIAWHQSQSDRSEQYRADQATYAQLQLQTGKLRSLPAQLSLSKQAAQAFVDARIPASDGVVISEIGGLAAADRVRWSRAAYTYRAAIPGIVEARVEANVTGEYAPIMHFINDLERDKNHAFFVIRSVTLTGQQGGAVNLRVRMTTYMLADASGAGPLLPANAASDDAGEGGGN